jgi:hypothetical protein
MLFEGAALPFICASSAAGYFHFAMYWKYGSTLWGRQRLQFICACSAAEHFHFYSRLHWWSQAQIADSVERCWGNEPVGHRTQIASWQHITYFAVPFNLNLRALTPNFTIQGFKIQGILTLLNLCGARWCDGLISRGASCVQNLQNETKLAETDHTHTFLRAKKMG